MFMLESFAACFEYQFSDGFRKQILTPWKRSIRDLLFIDDSWCIYSYLLVKIQFTYNVEDVLLMFVL